MRRMRVAAAIATIALASSLSGGASLAQEPCRFVLGFAALRDLVGAQKVGQCLEDEHFNLENGNAEQRTTGGLLVWRKVDNFTAFTDGGTTWVNGPAGLQSRPNAERFSWEKDPVQTATSNQAQPATPAASASPPTTARASTAPTATVRAASPPAPAVPRATPTPTAPTTGLTPALSARCREIVASTADRGGPTRDQQVGICEQLGDEHGTAGVDCYAKATKDIAPSIGRISTETLTALFDASLTVCKASIR
jgi:hypothetical protein